MRRHIARKRIPKYLSRYLGRLKHLTVEQCFVIIFTLPLFVQYHGVVPSSRYVSLCPAFTIPLCQFREAASLVLFRELPLEGIIHRALRVGFQVL